MSTIIAELVVNTPQGPMSIIVEDRFPEQPVVKFFPPAGETCILMDTISLNTLSTIASSAMDVLTNVIDDYHSKRNGESPGLSA